MQLALTLRLPQSALAMAFALSSLSQLHLTGCLPQ